MVAKFIPSDGAESTMLQLLSSDPELGVVPVLAYEARVCDGWDVFVMPRLTMLDEVLCDAAADVELVVAGINRLVEVRDVLLLREAVMVAHRLYCPVPSLPFTPGEGLLLCS